MTQPTSNPFLLAADNSPDLLPLLRTCPSLASAQDDHGYSLVHAAASYNHLDLLRLLVLELQVPVNLKDEDGETALFYCETVECARLLVEELRANTRIIGEDGKSAGEKIEVEGDFPDVATYLLQLEGSNIQTHDVEKKENMLQTSILNQAPPLPEGVSIDLGTLAPEEIGEEVADPEFKGRIEELAARGDFQGEEGQRELRDLITEAIRGQVRQERDVRRRTS